MNIFRDKKCALIDMDGVLYDSMPGHTLAWKRMMDDLGVDCSRDEFYLYEGMTGAATIDLLFERAFGKKCDPERSKELYAVKTRYFRELGQTRLMPGADKMLATLKKGGLQRVLVTGSGQASLLDAIDHDYPGMFDPGCRVTAHDVTKGKPDPEPYLRGAAKAGFKPDECFVIENAPLGVRAGKAAGCFTIAVTTGPIPREEFEKEGADIIFPSMPSFADWLGTQLGESGLSDLDCRLRTALRSLDYDKALALTDSNVRRLLDSEWDFADSMLEIEPGEGSKDIEGVCRVWEFLNRSGATRRSVLVNVGGGVVTDLGGFAASTFKRGIRFVNVPTTLLGMADAAIGGKTGIDFGGCKNEVGTFSMPTAVVSAPDVLKTLPREEILSGFAEVVKMALLTDRDLYRRLCEGDAPNDRALLGEAAAKAANSKQEIVTLDPKEGGLRRILNLGHTAGHAFESLAAAVGKPISHGEAVAHGLLVALRLSVKLQGFPSDEAEEYKARILDRYYSPLPFGSESTGKLIELMGHDKKNLRGGEISFVLLRSVGNPVESVAVDSGMLAEAIRL